MVYISFFDSSLEIIQTKRTILGERIVASVHETVPEGIIVKGKIVNITALTHLIQSMCIKAYPRPITDTKLSVAIPDYSLLFERFAIPKDHDIRDEMQRVLATAAAKAAHNPQEYENYYKVLAQTDDSTLVFYTAIEKEVLHSYVVLAQQLGMELEFTSTRTFAAYEIIRDLIQETQTVVCVAIHAHAVEYMMLDAYGPVAYAFHTKAPEDKAAGAVRSAITALHDPKTMILGGVLLTGEGAMEESVTDYAADLGVPVQKLEEVMGRILKTAKIPFDSGGVPQMLYTFPLGLYLGKRRSDAPNFTLEAAGMPAAAAAVAAPMESSPAVPQEVFPVVEHRSTRTPLAVFLAFLALGLAAGAFFLWRGGGLPMALPMMAKPTPTVAPSATPTIVVTPTIDPSLKRSDLKVMVQNGTAKSGYAKEVADELEKNGYEDVDRGNADTKDYTQTIVKIKPSQKAFTPIILSDLKDRFPTAKEEALDEKDAHDVIIILGE